MCYDNLLCLLGLAVIRLFGRFLSPVTCIALHEEVVEDGLRHLLAILIGFGLSFDSQGVAVPAVLLSYDMVADAVVVVACTLRRAKINVARQRALPA